MLNTRKLANEIEEVLLEEIKKSSYVKADGSLDPEAYNQARERIRKKAKGLAQSIEAFVKSATVTVHVAPGSVIYQVTGGAGAPAVGVPNPSPVKADSTLGGGLS